MVADYDGQWKETRKTNEKAKLNERNLVEYRVDRNIPQQKLAPPCLKCVSNFGTHCVRQKEQ